MKNNACTRYLVVHIQICFIVLMNSSICTTYGLSYTVRTNKFCWAKICIPVKHAGLWFKMRSTWLKPIPARFQILPRTWSTLRPKFVASDTNLEFSLKHLGTKIGKSMKKLSPTLFIWFRPILIIKKNPTIIYMICNWFSYHDLLKIFVEGSYGSPLL